MGCVSLKYRCLTLLAGLPVNQGLPEGFALALNTLTSPLWALVALKAQLWGGGEARGTALRLTATPRLRFSGEDPREERGQLPEATSSYVP